VRSSIKVTPPSDAAMHRCVQNLIQVFDIEFINVRSTHSLIGMDNAVFVASAERDECTSFVSSSRILVGRVTKNGIASVEVFIDKNAYAAVTIRGNTATPAYYVRLALQESLRTRRHVPLTVDYNNPDNIVAYVDSTYVVFGGKAAFTEALPPA
ncbi:hypothetical protein BGZ95_006067, partial [Linnemannia exigua]